MKTARIAAKRPCRTKAKTIATLESEWARTAGGRCGPGEGVGAIGQQWGAAAASETIGKI